MLHIVGVHLSVKHPQLEIPQASIYSLSSKLISLFPSPNHFLCVFSSQASSTHGAGDIPDNLSPFYEALQEQKPDLSAVRFGAIGIGSREYDTFCGAIDKLEAELKNSGAKQTGETLKINILDHDIPEDPAEEWLGSWINLLK